MSDANTGIMIIVFSVVSFIIYRLLEERPFGSYIEQRLYWKLVERGHNPRKQVKCGPYYIDIVIGNIAIECDGKDFHSSPAQKKYDKKRTSYLYRHGYKSVLRFTGTEINRNVTNCAWKIEQKLGGR